MQNRVPIAREVRPALPDFDPVPRQYHRHDGWTPERQKAFIEALADTGSVTRAAAMVNMARPARRVSAGHGKQRSISGCSD
jgi:hypothetical protein